MYISSGEIDHGKLLAIYKIRKYLRTPLLSYLLKEL
jgi:hypothetical protein